MDQATWTEGRCSLFQLECCWSHYSIPYKTTVYWDSLIWSSYFLWHSLCSLAEADWSSTKTEYRTHSSYLAVISSDLWTWEDWYPNSFHYKWWNWPSESCYASLTRFQYNFLSMLRTLHQWSYLTLDWKSKTLWGILFDQCYWNCSLSTWFLFLQPRRSSSTE